MVGTIAYMAPEQALDINAVGASSDIFALGGTLYFLLTGQEPRWLKLDNGFLQGLREEWVPSGPIARAPWIRFVVACLPGPPGRAARLPAPRRNGRRRRFRPRGARPGAASALSPLLR
jgi:serine/threonine protein kinase